MVVDIQAGRKTERQKNRETDRQIGRKTERQKDRKTDKFFNRGAPLLKSDWSSVLYCIV